MSNFSSLHEQLSQRQPLPPLFPKTVFDKSLSPQIEAADLSDFERCGLLMLNDDLDAAHSVVQNLPDDTSAFWHAIMHRREGDASNAKYWWRRTENHAAFGSVYENVRKYLQSENDAAAQQFLSQLEAQQNWLPVAFVDACQSGDAEWLRQVQIIEMETLLSWCRENDR